MTEIQTLPSVLVKAPEWSPVAAIRKEAAEYYAQLFIARFPSWAERSGSRLAKAVEICAKVGACRRTEDPAVFHVKSDSNPLGQYRVDMREKTCTCPDHGKNRHGPQVICKHRLAIALHVYGPIWSRDEIITQIRAQTKSAEEIQADIEKGMKDNAIYFAKTAAREAWKQVIRAASHYETLWQLDYNDPRVVAARERMLAANAKAAQLQDEYERLAD